MKSSKTEVDRRVTEVLHLRLQGAEYWDILQHSAEQGWGLKERQLREYMSRADDLLALAVEKDREKLLNRHLAQRRALFARCMAVADYSNARAVLKDEAELLNLYPAKRTEITGKDGGPVEHAILSPDERLAALAALHAAVGAGPGAAPADGSAQAP
jgi:hypothetical protein